MTMRHHEPPTPAAFRRALSTLTVGDTVHTGILDPWTADVEAPREERVTARNRLTITTDLSRYWFTGRETGPSNLFFYPRIIYRIPGEDS